MLRPIPENFGLPKHGGPSCCLASGKKGIRPCQGLTIWTSFYLLLLLSNSKKKLPPQYPHNLTFASPHPVCFISRPASTSNYLEYYIWGKPPREDPVAARQISVSGKKTGSGTDFRILSRLALWIIISVINFPSSPTILIGDSPPTLWPRSTEVTNVFPWKQTCHAIVTAGLSNEIQLCQRRTSWWPDWSRISATVWLLTTAMLLNCVRALAVIVRHMHKTVSFGLFVSRPLFFPALSLSHHTSFSFFFLPFLWLVFHKGSAHCGLMTPASWNTGGEKKPFFYPIWSESSGNLEMTLHTWFEKLRKFPMIRRKWNEVMTQR